MKKLTRLKLALAILSTAFLGSCSSQMYTFAPNSGGYHGTEKKTTEVAVSENMPAAEPTAVADLGNDAPADLAPAHTQAAAALANAGSLKSTEQSAEKATVTDKKAAKQTLKQAKADLKKLKKDIKDGQETKGSVNRTAIVLILIGLILALLGGGSIIGAIGVIFIVVGLILILLDLL